MLPVKALELALTRVPVTRFEGLLCRAVHSGTLYGFLHRKLYTPRPLYNLGPPTNGARFTPKGGAPALYLAQDFETSLREYLQLGKSARLTPRSEKEGAIVCFTAKVRLDSVLRDLPRHDPSRNRWLDARRCRARAARQHRRGG
jgi:RES domain-containing protein